tara:strand:+ start:3205 stop:4374 length:1170 start_codon:yes stop_codon:yes gene_type:complete
MKSKKIYYLSYDGILNPLGISQIFKYILLISKIGSVKFLSFEKENDLKNENLFNNINDQIKYNNIKWIKKKYYYKKSKFLHIFYIFINFIFYSIFFCIKNNYIFHIRGYLPLIFLLIPSYFINLNIIFDMRGYWHHEKVDRMNWKKNSLKFYIFNKIEKYFLIKSIKIICLTNDAKQYLSKFINGDKIIVLPTCVDTTKFNYFKYNHKTINLCYMGTTSGAYDFIKTLKIFNNLRKLDKKYCLYIYTREDYGFFKSIINKFNLDIASIKFKKLEYNEVSENLKLIDYGFFFLKKNFSITASFPTKISEFLSSGIPIITNNFNLHVTDLINNNSLGFVLDDQKIEDLHNFIQNNLNDKKIINNCINISKEQLSLDYAFKIYTKIYNNISQ